MECEDIKYLFDFSRYHRKKTEQKQCGFSDVGRSRS